MASNINDPISDVTSGLTNSLFIYINQFGKNLSPPGKLIPITIKDAKLITQIFKLSFDDNLDLLYYIEDIFLKNNTIFFLFIGFILLIVFLLTLLFFIYT